MGRTLQNVLVSMFVLAAAYLIVSPLVSMVARSMDDSANMIAEASWHAR